MTPAPFLFLLTVLWSERGLSLQCYVCNATKYVGCKSVVNCSTSESFCIKFTETTISGFMIKQSCAIVCPIAKKKWPPLYTFMCCQTDLCNRASGVESGRTLLVVATVLSSVRALVLLGL